jgi:hypothetical protein
LVVEHHRAFVGEGFQRFQVVMGGAWTAVDGDERDRLGPADDAVPDPTAGNLGRAFAGVHSGHEAPKWSEKGGRRRDKSLCLSTRPTSGWVNGPSGEFVGHAGPRCGINRVIQTGSDLW